METESFLLELPLGKVLDYLRTRSPAKKHAHSSNDKKSSRLAERYADDFLSFHCVGVLCCQERLSQCARKTFPAGESFFALDTFFDAPFLLYLFPLSYFSSFQIR